MESNKEPFGITLRPAIGIAADDWYLSLIRALVNKLREYIPVVVDSEELLDYREAKLQRDSLKGLWADLEYRAKLENKSMRELIEKYGVETLGLTKEFVEAKLSTESTEG